MQGMRWLLSVLVWGLIPSLVTAQPNGAVGARSRVNPETVPRPTFRAARRTSPITIDGRPDEAAWAAAPLLTDFVQQLPETGAPAKYRTEVRVLYDSTTLYVAGVNHDPHPERAITVGLERDFVTTNSGSCSS